MSSRQARIEQIEVHLMDKFHLPREQIGEMIPNFIVALATHLTTIEDAVAQGDLTEIGRAGHTMKGALLNLGLNDCVEIALEIEQCGKGNDSSANYRQMSEELRKQLEVLID